MCLSENNALFGGKINDQEIETYAELHGFSSRYKNIEDNSFSYKHLSATSYYGLVGDPDAILVSVTSTLNVIVWKEYNEH